MKENLFVDVEYSPVKHPASRFSVRKNVTKKKKKEGKKERKMENNRVLYMYSKTGKND